MSKRFGSVLRLPEVATPTEIPAAGSRLLYVRTDGLLYTKNSSNLETPVVTVSPSDLNDRDTLFWMGV